MRLFPNYREVERDYYQRTGIFPIMHLVAIRRDIYEKHPFIATSLYNAFNESKNLALEKMNETGALRYMLPWLGAELDEIDEVFGGDPWPYGIEANRPTLEALVTYLAEQNLIAKSCRSRRFSFRPTASIRIREWPCADHPPPNPPPQGGRERIEKALPP